MALATTAADRQAAHLFLSELRTRIATQPLPYQQGIEAKALESLFQLFEHARSAMKSQPGCDRFALAVTAVLNHVVRPVTGAFDLAHERGQLLSRDGGDEFRAALANVQRQLRRAARGFGLLAYGRDVQDRPAPPAIADDRVEQDLAELAFGIPIEPSDNGGIPAGVAADLNASERASIVARRKLRAPLVHGDSAFGLALSGGGIRSATFCLGVIQVLADRGLLGQVDYLSTVSGGGYAGSMLSARLGDRGFAPSELGRRFGPDPDALQVVRRRAQFLGGSLLQSWQMAVETVLGMACNWCVPLTMIGLCSILAVWLGRAGLYDILPHVALVLAAITGVGGWVFFWQVRKPTNSAKWSGAVIAGSSIVLALGVGALAVDAVFASLFPGLEGSKWCLKDLVYELDRLRSVPGVQGLQTLLAYASGATLPHANAQSTSGLGWLVAALVGTLAPAVLRFLPLLERPMVRKIATMAALAVAAISIPALGLLVFLVLYTLGGVTAGDGAGPIDWVWWLAAGTAALGLLTGVVLNINATSPHRLYRRGLSRTFVEPALKKQKEREQKEKEQEQEVLRMALAELDDAAPYHLINATVNLPGSKHPGLADRGCDFFLMSRHWMGSPVVGYESTTKWKMDQAEPDLATAMAISGAAFSSNMGLGSIAPLRALLAFLNVRLGYWIHNPRHKARKWIDAYPRFLCLLYEMTGVRLHEGRPWLNLSDGGHIENLGVYELLRRRCKFVLCVDGEADPQHTFQGLMTMVRHAQIDLGVRIDPDLRELRPDPKTGHCRSHYHMCRITYPPTAAGSAGGTGLLLYVKLSLTGNESELIQRYRGNNPAFPHQTTLDQFFDEEQFEAYRQLGAHAADGLFGEALMQDRAGKLTSPVTVREWYRRLAEKLLA